MNLRDLQRIVILSKTVSPPVFKVIVESVNRIYDQNPEEFNHSAAYSLLVSLFDKTTVGF